MNRCTCRCRPVWAPVVPPHTHLKHLRNEGTTGALGSKNNNFDMSGQCHVRGDRTGRTGQYLPDGPSLGTKKCRNDGFFWFPSCSFILMSYFSSPSQLRAHALPEAERPRPSRASGRCSQSPRPGLSRRTGTVVGRGQGQASRRVVRALEGMEGMGCGARAEGCGLVRVRSHAPRKARRLHDDVRTMLDVWTGGRMAATDAPRVSVTRRNVYGSLR